MCFNCLKVNPYSQLEHVWKSGEACAESSLFLHRNRVETMAIGHGDIIATGDRIGFLFFIEVLYLEIFVVHVIRFQSQITFKCFIL